MTRATRYALLGLGLALLASCAGHRSPGGPSPSAIVIENASGGRLAVVTLEQWPQKQGSSVRMGSISPVPRDASQVIVRSATSLALPREIRIEWVDDRGTRFSEVRAIDGLVAAFERDPQAALVFRIGPLGILDIVVGETP
jgi:hypothetical protein